MGKSQGRLAWLGSCSTGVTISLSRIDKSIPMASSVGSLVSSEAASRRDRPRGIDQFEADQLDQRDHRFEVDHGDHRRDGVGQLTWAVVPMAPGRQRKAKQDRRARDMAPCRMARASGVQRS